MRIDQLAYRIAWTKKKLIPVIAQDYVTRQVLMMAYADAAALGKTMETGFAHYWSRSRRTLWKKGERSGHVQEIVEILADCDGDALLYRVKQTGPACHSGEHSCFNSPLSESRETTRKQIRPLVNEITEACAQNPIVERRWHGKGTRSAYRYIINPLTENIPPPNPVWSEWIANRIHEQSSNDIDKVLTGESMGLPIAQLVASLKGKPLAIARKRNLHNNSYLLAKVRYASGFEHGTYWIYGIERTERVLIVDDAISTGGALLALLAALKENGVIITDAFCVLEKPEYRGVENVRKTTGIGVKTLFRVNTRSRKCVPTHYVTGVM